MAESRDDSMRVDVRVDGSAPLSEQDVFALACRVINMSATKRRARGCREPFKHLRTVGEICHLLAFTDSAEAATPVARLPLLSDAPSAACAACACVLRIAVFDSLLALLWRFCAAPPSCS